MVNNSPFVLTINEKQLLSKMKYNSEDPAMMNPFQGHLPDLRQAC